MCAQCRLQLPSNGAFKAEISAKDNWPWESYIRDHDKGSTAADFVQWGQRVSGMVNMNGDLYFSTSCMNPETDHEVRHQGTEALYCNACRDRTVCNVASRPHAPGSMHARHSATKQFTCPGRMNVESLFVGVGYPVSSTRGALHPPPKQSRFFFFSPFLQSRGLIPESAELEYGAVHRLSHAYEVGGRLLLPGAAAKKTTRLVFTVTSTAMIIKQDGVIVGSKALKSAPQLPASAALEATPCFGIYGACPPSTNVAVTIS